MQTTTLTRTVIAVFDDDSTAQRAVQALIARGYTKDQIELTHRNSYATESERDDEGGGISGFFRRLFGTDTDDDDRTYTEAVRHGAAVVMVSTHEGDENRAADILNDNGAIDIESKRATLADTPVPPADRDLNASANQRSIPVVEEQLRVGKRLVQRGGVRVYNRVHEQPVEQKVNLREERVRVDRRRADRPATEADFQNRDEVIEVSETAEEPVVEKRTRVVEEVVVGKEVRNRTEVIRDTVRRSDVEVEPIRGEPSGPDFRSDFERRYASVPAARYDTYAPAYDFGYRMASDERYRGRNWDDIEPHLRTDYERQYPGSRWEQFKDAARHGWNKMLGRA